MIYGSNGSCVPCLHAYLLDPCPGVPVGKVGITGGFNVMNGPCRKSDPGFVTDDEITAMGIAAGRSERLVAEVDDLRHTVWQTGNRQQCQQYSMSYHSDCRNSWSRSSDFLNIYMLVLNPTLPIHSLRSLPTHIRRCHRLTKFNTKVTYILSQLSHQLP